jgi:HSP20 family protein
MNMTKATTMAKHEVMPTMTDRWMMPFRDIFDRDLKTWFEGFRFPAMEEIRVEEYVTDDDMLVINAEVPGVDPEKDIDITIDDGMLLLKVERKEESTEEKEGMKRSEFRYGSFRRTLPVPKGVDVEAIKATYTDGILQVMVPVPQRDREQVTKVPVTKR